MVELANFGFACFLLGLLIGMFWRWRAIPLAAFCLLLGGPVFYLALGGWQHMHARPEILWWKANNLRDVLQPAAFVLVSAVAFAAGGLCAYGMRRICRRKPPSSS